MFTKALAVALPLLALLAPFAEAGQIQNLVSTTYVTEDLNQGLDNWTSKELRYTRKTGKTEALFTGVVEDSRYGDTDTTGFLGFSTALRKGTILTGEVGGGHNKIVPKLYARSGFAQDLGDGLVLNIGLQRTGYVDAYTVGYAIGLEKYLGNFRVEAGLSATKPSFQNRYNGGYRMALDYYPSDTSLVGIFVAKGKETEATENGVVALDSQAFGGHGKLQLTDSLALLLTVAETSYEKAYTRKTVGLAMEFKF